MAKIDARGRSCPQPVMMTKNVVDAGEREVEVLIDNAISASNVQRFLEKNGFHVQIMDDDGTITLRGVKRDGSRPASSPAPQATVSQGKLQDSAVLITRKTLGGSDPELGEVLMKGFLGTLSQMETPPSLLALMNEGVKLAVRDTSSCDHLAALGKKGVRILVCGTCTNHFGITVEIGTGTISNMFEITEGLLSCGRMLSL